MRFSKRDRNKLLEMAGEPPEPARRSEVIESNPAIVLPLAESHGHARHVVTIARWLPTRLNVLLNSHHMEAHSRKTADASVVAVSCLMAGFTAAIGKRRLEYTLIYPKVRKRVADSDAFDKSLRDALVRCRVLVDDSPKWLEATIPAYEFSTEGPATRIVLTDV